MIHVELVQEILVVLIATERWIKVRVEDPRTPPAERLRLLPMASRLLEQIHGIESLRKTLVGPPTNEQVHQWRSGGAEELLDRIGRLSSVEAISGTVAYETADSVASTSQMVRNLLGPGTHSAGGGPKTKTPPPA